jgi:hypothetical protein
VCTSYLQSEIKEGRFFPHFITKYYYKKGLGKIYKQHFQHLGDFDPLWGCIAVFLFLGFFLLESV